jgi:hypothetical protein
MDWTKVPVSVLGEYTTKAIQELEKKGDARNPDSIRSMRYKLYSRDIEIASIVNGMKLK